MAIERTKQLIESRDSFAIKTTMSGTVLSQTLQQAADAGYYSAIKLLRVETVDVSSKRVARRVQQGGHDIPMVDQMRGGAMSGPSTTPNPNNRRFSSVVGEDSILNDLLSGDIDRQRMAAAIVRAYAHAREQARAYGTTLVYSKDGVVTEYHPNSPELPDLTELLAIADRLFPRS